MDWSGSKPAALTIASVCCHRSNTGQLLWYGGVKKDHILPLKYSTHLCFIIVFFFYLRSYVVKYLAAKVLQ